MASPAQPIPAPQRITASNLPISASTAADPKSEPGVEVIVDTLPVDPIAGLPELGRARVATTKSVPASNDGHGNIPLDDVPGVGIVLANGINVYYIDIAPHSEGTMHRTTSTDYIIVVQGTLSFMTPAGPFNVETGYGEAKETLAHPGSTVVQRGIMHALSNRTDQYVRLLGVVVSSAPNRVPVEADSSSAQQEPRILNDAWLP
ncbi:hypothetical protein F5Y18DRAFT_196449 [Xylariaceae sp. FL1019]|nr:hypothetical protein F5Y18DRAFT_196449 [Xylariaceae sp. FL1019]